ncbi:MAG: DUF3857 and transglutaminase domain-containing protein [bacterium]|nr:DUF3857 and transglutaminase domain-containing protein [bacterium]
MLRTSLALLILLVALTVAAEEEQTVPPVSSATAMTLLDRIYPAEGAYPAPELLEDAEAIRLLVEADATPYEGANSLVLFDRTLVDVEESGLSHRHHHRFVKILEPAGALALRALRFEYDPASNFIELRGVRIHRADSTVVVIDTDLAVDVTQPAGTIIWGARMKVLGLPPLKPGDGVELLTYTKGFLIAYLDDETLPDGTDGSPGAATSSDLTADERYIPPMRGHFYDTALFQGHTPLLEKSYTAVLRRAMPLQFSVYNGDIQSSQRFEGERLVYRFWKHDVPAVVDERRMPELNDIAPKVVMATTTAWEDKSRWFCETNEWVFATTPAIDAKVREITAGLKSDAERIKALHHWVAQNIRYFGLTMGEGEGYTIHPGDMTFRDRCGVCKDIAGMLVTMLRSAGFETYGAMTMAGERVEEIPADQFNHCVVALRRENGEFLMLDPTWAPWNNSLWSRWEGEQHYVIGTPEGQELMKIRPFAPEDNLLTLESEAKLLADGTLEGTFRFEGRGISDGRLRGAAGNREHRTLRGYLEGWLSALGDQVELKEYLFSDHNDFNRDTTLRLIYRIPRYADVLGGEMAFRSPGLQLTAENGSLSRLAGVPEGETRLHDIFMWAGQLISLDETITLPRGYDVESPDDIDIDENQGAAQLTWSTQGRKLTLDADMTLNRRLIPAEDFPGLRVVVDAIQDRASEPFHAVK